MFLINTCKHEQTFEENYNKTSYQTFDTFLMFERSKKCAERVDLEKRYRMNT